MPAASPAPGPSEPSGIQRAVEPSGIYAGYSVTDAPCAIPVAFSASCRRRPSRSSSRSPRPDGAP